jgi:hypothetical protein
MTVKTFMDGLTPVGSDLTVSPSMTGAGHLSVVIREIRGQKLFSN